MQPHGHDPGRLQITSRRQFLTADNVFMVDAGQINGRAHAAVDLFNHAVVVLKRANAHALAPRQPLHFIAYPDAAGRHRSCHHGSMALDDEGAIDGHAEPFPLTPTPLPRGGRG